MPDEADTLDPMEARVEKDRAALVGTVDALRARVTSTADDYADRYSMGALRGRVGDRVLEQVRTRPLQTAALAAGAAYPVVRLVSRIPAPILLMGAGVALAGRTGGKGDTTVEMSVTHGTASLEGDGTDYRDPSVTGTGGMGGADARDAAGGLRDAAAAKFDETVDDVTGAATDAYGRGARAVSEARRRVDRFGRNVSDTVSGGAEDLRDAAREGVQEVLATARQRPLVTAGVSLLIGGAIAALLPRTRVEDRLVGDEAEAVRERARRAAREGVASARRVVEAAREEARDQNLTAEGARAVARDAGSRVRKAADDMIEDVADEVSNAAGGERNAAGGERNATDKDG